MLGRSGSKATTNKPTGTLTSSTASVGSASGDDHITFYVSIPSMNGLSLKRFPASMPVKDVIQKLGVLLPDKDTKSLTRYHIYSNGLRLMDEDRPLSSYNTLQVLFYFHAELKIQRNRSTGALPTIELKRGIEYELECEKNPNPLFLTDITFADATRVCICNLFPTHAQPMALHAFPQLKNPASFEYTIRKVSMTEDQVADPAQRIMLAKLQEGVS